MTSLAKFLTLIAADETIVIFDFDDCSLENFEVYRGPVFGVPEDVIDDYGYSPVMKISTTMDANCEVEISIFHIERPDKEIPDSEEETSHE